MGAVLIVANGWMLHIVRAENRKEISDMPNEKVIMLIEAKIQPQRRADGLLRLRALSFLK